MKMPVLDTGPIDNRGSPRTSRLAIRLSNSGRLPATVGVEVYHVNPAGDGFTNETIYLVRLVSLNPFGQPGSGFTVDNVFADLDVFGVRVITSGQGGNDAAVTVSEMAADGQVLKEHVLTGELARIRELLFVYATHEFDDAVTVINTGTGSIVANISLPTGSRPRGIAITPDGTRAYVANLGTDTVTVIDTAANTILTTIPLPPDSGPIAIAITPDGSRAYAVNSDAESVSVINTSMNSVIADIPLPDGPLFGGLAVTPDGSRVYVTDASEPYSVVVINALTNTILTTIPLIHGVFPTSVAIAPDGSRAYVSTLGSSSVEVIDIHSNTVIASLPLAGGSFWLAVTPILLF
jgi:YVTN family beta-propeller protein